MIRKCPICEMEIIEEAKSSYHVSCKYCGWRIVYDSAKQFLNQFGKKGEFKKRIVDIMSNYGEEEGFSQRCNTIDKYDEVFLNVAFEISKLSKCISYQVGCVLVKDKRIISIGYNGTPSGFTNCCDKFIGKFDREIHHNWSSNFEVHAEMNCLLYACKNGICTDGTTMYLTMKPCHNCLKNIITAGVNKVYYKNEYDKAGYGDETQELIKHSKIQLIRMVGNE